MNIATLLTLDREDNIVNEQSITLDEIQSLSNDKVVRITSELLPTITAYGQYHAYTQLEHLKDCYSAKVVKEAIENLKEREKVRNSNDYKVLRDSMLFEEISPDLTLKKLYNAIKKDSGIVNFYCKDIDTNTLYKLRMQDTTKGLEVLCTVNNTYQIREADLIAGIDKNVNKTKVVDVIANIERHRAGSVS